jgi:pimeloyl-ACP methyl ester carboxylesterase
VSEPERPAALLVHSSGFSPRQWRRLAELLAPTHDVRSPDLLGYGASGPWPVGRPFHFRQDVERLAEVLDELGRPAHVVGHSYGGLLALHLALSRPASVRSLALYEPVAFGVLEPSEDGDAIDLLERAKGPYRPDPDGVDERWLEMFVEWWNGPGAWSTLPEPTRRDFKAVAWKVHAEVSSLWGDPTDREGFARIAAPTLLMTGGRTPLTERRVVERLASALPHATVEAFPELGHMGPVTDARSVNAAIVAHLARS